MKNKNKTIHVKPGPSERRLKICAVVISLLFAALMLYPLIFAISSSMKDNAKIYEIPAAASGRSAPTAFLSS